MFGKTCKFIMLLGLLIRPHEQKTIVETWLTIPDYCLNPWQSFPNQCRMSLSPSLNMCMANAFAFADCRGVQCTNGTNICEGITWAQSSNQCVGPLKASTFSKVIVKDSNVISRDKDLFIFYGRTAQIRGVSIAGLEPISLPLLDAKIVPVLFKDGIVACDLKGKTCHHWQRGSEGWLPFPAMINGHNRGSLDNVGGKLLAIAGAIGGTPTKFVETFDGTKWVEQPQLSHPRKIFATVVINSTSIALIGGYNRASSDFKDIGSDFLIFHVDTKQWTILEDYPHKQAGLSCCNFDGGAVQGIFCIGGFGLTSTEAPAKQAFIFDWSTKIWARIDQFDFSDDVEYARGPIVQFKNSLFYKPISTMPGNNPQEKIFKIDWNATNPTWIDMGMDFLESGVSEALFLIADSYTIT
ncbi:uncharacterized protein LOC131891838 isoform X2 [Tigriopus californicus]|nr:uncharacterized protein LOC131891838 isoform X2 [Tigriopus californicus]XP_059097495.1 uncharacterized protein LOC131891838 isoform X2 [Tigriopus californicus]